VSTATPAPAADPNWRGPSPFLSVQEHAVVAFLFLCAAVTVFTTAGIILVLGVETVEFFRVSKVPVLSFLFGTEINPAKDLYGVLPLVWGTFVVAAGSSMIALPIGLLSAIYLSEYAPRKLRAVLKPALELLAGIPTIVYGYIALLLVTPALKAVFESGFMTRVAATVQSWLGREPQPLQVETFNALSACVVVGVMIIPIISSLSEDVLSAVPQGLREAGYALGATKFEVSTRVVLPAALSGVVASFILAVSRAIGETMAVVLAAGMLPQITLNPLTSIETMTTYIVQTNSGESSYGTPKHLSLYAVGMALFAVTLLLNIISGLVLRRYRVVYQ
jgi:phosphate transport system permease protein